MQEQNFDLRPPLPPHDYPYPRCCSHVSQDDGASEGGGGQGPAKASSEEDDGDFAAFPLKANLVLRSMLCRMFASAEVMQLGSETRFTSLVLFHRYYLASNVTGTISQEEENSTDDNKQDGSSSTRVSQKWREHLGIVAASCLFLGCKVEEEHRRIRDVINVSHMFDFAGARGDIATGKSANTNGQRTNDDQQPSAISTTTNENQILIHEANSPPDLDDEYWKAKEQIVATEQEVLRMLHFDVSVSHPHRAVLLILNGLGINVTRNNTEGQTLANESFTALNDALFYPPALRHGVLPLACGALRLAAAGDGGGKHGPKSSAGGADAATEISSLLPPGAWWRRFDVADADVELVIKSLERARASLRSI